MRLKRMQVGLEEDIWFPETNKQLLNWKIDALGSSFFCCVALFWQLEAHQTYLVFGPLVPNNNFNCMRRCSRFSWLGIMDSTSSKSRAVYACQKWAGISCSTRCFLEIWWLPMIYPSPLFSSQGHHSIDKGWSRMCTLALMWARFGYGWNKSFITHVYPSSLIM